METNMKIMWTILVLGVAALIYFGPKISKDAPIREMIQITKMHEAETNQNPFLEGTSTNIQERKYSFYSDIVATNFDNWYFGEVLRIVDGDTLDINIDLGMGVSVIKKVRMAGINAPELDDLDYGKKSKAFLEKMLKNKKVIIQAKSTPDKYGRLLCTLFTIDGKTNINERMVTSGQAENY